MKRHKLVLSVVAYPIFLILATLVFYPLLWMVMSSFKNNIEIIRNVFGPPSSLKFDNYVAIFQDGNMGRYFLNSAIVTVVSVVLLLIISSVSAYGFSTFKFKYNSILFMYCLIGLMVPPQALIISNFNWISILGLLSTYWALILTYLGWGSLGILILRDFFNAVPKEITDAARIDGASHWQIFTRIMLPLARPSMATISIFYIMWIWNDYIYPLIYMQDPQMFTIPLGILFMNDRFAANWGNQMAGLTVATIPPIVAYLIFQRQYVKGLLAGAIKG